MPPAIRVHNLGKRYRLGLTHARSLNELAARCTARLRGHSAAEAGLKVDHQGRTTGGDFWALQDIDFEVGHGEVVGIIGRNGAGKSTLLKLLSRVTRPTTGQIDIHGRVGSLLEVGTGFHPELTGRENVYMNGTILGMTKKEVDRRFDEIVDFSGVERFIDTPVKRYSSGMKVRLGFAVAAHLEPEILIVDEVLAVGDAAFQRKCLGKMSEVAGHGRTVLFVSHNMAAVESLCSRGIVLQQGKIIFSGDQPMAITRYLDSTGIACSASDSGSTRLHRPSGKDFDAWMTNVSISSIDGQDDGIIKNNSALLITVEIESTKRMPCPQLGIGIDSSQQLRVTTLHTSFTNDIDGVVDIGHSVLQCEVQGLSLVPGSYSLKLALDPIDCPRHEVEGVCMFTVVGSAQYSETGKHGRGVVLCEQRWRRLSSGTFMATSKLNQSVSYNSSDVV